VKCGEWDGNRCSPALIGDLGFGSPDAIPARVAVLSLTEFFLVSNEGIALRAERIDLEYICVATVVSGVNDDFKIVIQLLSDVAAQLRGSDAARIRRGASDCKIDFAARVENADFCELRGGPAFERFALSEIGDCLGLLPKRIIQGPIHLGWAVHTNRL